MRFMVLIEAGANSEARVPGEELLAGMGRFNEELVNAGVMQAGEGMHPSAKGARVRADDLGEAVMPELREQEERLRARLVGADEA